MWSRLALRPIFAIGCHTHSHLTRVFTVLPSGTARWKMVLLNPEKKEPMKDLHAVRMLPISLFLEAERDLFNLKELSTMELKMPSWDDIKVDNLLLFLLRPRKN